MKKLLIAASITAASASLWWAFAQNAPQPLASLIPAGALVYLEAKDAGALVRDWDGSTEKTTWLDSSNYAAFSRSHLFQRLNQAQTEFAKAAGVPPDYALFSNVAGANSAIAIYDIGSLEFLYLTRLPNARVVNSALWRTRGTYQTRRAGGVDYYVKEDRASHRTAAFAYQGDLLLLATRQEALTGALELLARQNRPSLASEAWYQAATTAAAPGDHDLRLVYNLERLLQTPHFRSYWIQRNMTALAEFSGGLADLEKTRTEIRERRVILRANPESPAIAQEQRTGSLLALAPDDAGLYRLWAKPTADQALAWMETKLFGTSKVPTVKRESAPVVNETPDEGSTADLEGRIDEVPLADDRVSTALAPVRALLTSANLEGMLELGSTAVDPDQVYVRTRSALVLQSATPWNPDQVRAALTSAASGLWSSAGLGAGWRNGANGAQELDGLAKLALAFDGNRLILSDSPELTASILARRGRNAAGALYEAGWRHGRENANFERLTRLIDFPQHPTGGDNQETEPMFYSENLASLGRTLGRVDSATLTVHDLGNLLRETVLYRLRP